MPLVGRIEKPSALPGSITEPVLRPSEGSKKLAPAGVA
jgi:hypothetical protein